MNIFEQYGIKEVADVCLYAIELDENDDEVYVPVLYLDTLKISTVEETAEQTSARGGLGNPELIIWDYGKEITVTLEDALYSPASQGMTWGGKFGAKKFTLYGEVGVQNLNEEMRIVPCHFIIDSFSNFEIAKDTYTWNVCINIVSTDNTVRERVENVPLYYNLTEQKWSFSEEEYVLDVGLKLGTLLKQNGFEVYYSRTNIN